MFELIKVVTCLSYKLQVYSHEIMPNLSPGEIVAVFYKKWNKWIRAKISGSKEESKTLKLFLIDHGHYIHFDASKSESKSLQKIPKHLKMVTPIILQGSLGLTSVQIVKDRATLKDISDPVKVWDHKAIEFVKRFHEHRDCYDFSFLLQEKRSDHIHVGELIANNRNRPEIILIGDKLISNGFAVKDNMKDSHLKPTKQQVLLNSNPDQVDNKKKSSKMSDFSSKYNKKEETEMLNNSEALCNIQDISIRKPRLEIFKPTTESKEPFTSITDIFLYGKNQKKAYEAFNEVPKEWKNKEKLSESFGKLQSYIWPQIYSDLPVMIVNDNKNSSHLLYLPPLINLIEKNRRNIESDGMGPIAIIVTKSVADVKVIFNYCSFMFPDLMIVELVKMMDKKVEIINGCDLLISTPAAFNRLIKGVSFNIIDKNRIKHLVLDRVDEILAEFKNELKSVMKYCTNGSSNTEKNPQIIVTASMWTKHLEYFMNSFNQNKLILCIKNFIEVAAFIGCKMKLELSLDIKHRIFKLANELKKEFDEKTEKKILVVAKTEKNLTELSKELKELGINFQFVDEKNYNNFEECFGLLLISDRILDKAKIRNVEHLIHFDFTNRNSFSRRFDSMAENFYKMAESKIKNPSISSTIFVSDENTSELTKLIKFLNAGKIWNIPENILKTVEKINNYNELSKSEQKVRICDGVWQYGSCKDSLCLFRHHLFKELDQPSAHLIDESVIKFEIMSIRNPTSFIIKIISHNISHSKMISLEQENKKTESFLDEDFQEFFNEKEKQQRTELKVGQTYAVFTDSKWHRCELIEITNKKIVKVYLIDIGVEIPCNESKLFQLPNRFMIIKPLICKLKVLNLVPIDRERFWDSDANAEISNLIKLSKIFICRIQMAVRDILFTESFDAVDDKTGVHNLRLRKKMLEMNICSVDESVGEKLRSIIKDVGILYDTKDLRNDSAKENSSENYEKICEIENWKQLSFKSCYKIKITHFINPESFLVILPSSSNKVLENALKKIENFNLCEPLRKFEIGGVCGVHREIFYRGKIIQLGSVDDDDDIQVLLADYGDVIKCKKSELMELPNELASRISFQVIHCRMVGVRPKFNMKLWPQLQRQYIMNLISEYDELLKICVIKRNEKGHDMSKLGMNSYDVLLFDFRNGSHIDDIIVNKKFADREKIMNCEEINAIIESEVNDNCYEMVTNGKQDNELSEDQKDYHLEILKRLLENKLAENSPIEEKQGIVEKTYEKNPSLSPSKPDELPLQKVVPMNYIYKQPRIDWWQNDVVVYLLISAVDCENYSLMLSRFKGNFTDNFDYEDLFDDEDEFEISDNGAKMKLEKDEKHKWQTKMKELETKLHEIECENSQLSRKKKKCLLEESSRRNSDELERLKSNLIDSQGVVQEEHNRLAETSRDLEERIKY
ncbi:CLUMA_CG014281, isoform A [Clunio marinus]|uniref:RNA helicase n=1 Tax=Clunio marinus TaxID=568069 RepID=A0A1J1IMS3_9DIPT|nr:CLUMA_CG014281, isoform A [Clunio marinus]